MKLKGKLKLIKNEKFNYFFFVFIINFLNSCSFDGNKTGIWKEHNKKIIEEVKLMKILRKYLKNQNF